MADEGPRPAPKFAHSRKEPSGATTSPAPAQTAAPAERALVTPPPPAASPSPPPSVVVTPPAVASPPRSAQAEDEAARLAREAEAQSLAEAEQRKREGRERWARATAEMRERETFTVGLIGGKASGKTFLFQALAYRTLDRDRAGCLTRFLGDQGVQIFHAIEDDHEGRMIPPTEFQQSYWAWEKLAQTMRNTMNWYKLRVDVRTGLFGRGHEAMDVQLLDASGEDLALAGQDNEQQRYMWDRAYGAAEVMVFCVPIWTLFPGHLSEADRQSQRESVDQLDRILVGLRVARARWAAQCKAARRPVPRPYVPILALTMADDERSALGPVRTLWIDNFHQHYEESVAALGHGGTLVRYLESARRLSDALHVEVSKLSPRFSSLLKGMQEAGSPQPWILPVSAIEGKYLGKPENERPSGYPRPVHTELPILVALCRRYNALM